MDRKIVLTYRFKKNYDSTLDYLLKEWSPTVALRFIKKVYERIESIKQNPSIGKPSSQINGVRSVLVKPFNRMYYTISDTEIRILALIDTRRKVNRLK